MDGEARGEIPTQPPGEAAGARDEDLAGSGWTTTKQAAKVLGVSRRSVQGYVRRGILEAQEEGEGVTKRFIVSIDSLNALRERRNDEAVAAEEFAGASAEVREAANLGTNAGEGLRHVVDRLEARTAEATELRVRLEITEKAESTVRAELAEERRRREEAEREREDLRRELQALQEAREPPRAPVLLGALPRPPDGIRGPQGDRRRAVSAGRGGAGCSADRRQGRGIGS
jgi:FtsZ-binding cell division protein ZapB